MTTRIVPFFGGCAFSTLLLLSYTYDNERKKQLIKDEIKVLYNMN